MASRAASAMTAVAGLSDNAAIVPPELALTDSTASASPGVAATAASLPSRVPSRSAVKNAVPSTAMPSADPVCRAVLWVAEPCPLRSTGTSARITDVSCAVASPTPNP